MDVPTDRPSVPCTNPANGEVIAEVPISNAEDVDAAVAIAVKAQEKWGKQTYKTRVQCLFKLKQLMEQRSDEIVEIVKLEHGKNVAEGKASLMKGTLFFSMFKERFVRNDKLQVSRLWSGRHLFLSWLLVSFLRYLVEFPVVRSVALLALWFLLFLSIFLLWSLFGLFLSLLDVVML